MKMIKYKLKQWANEFVIIMNSFMNHIRLDQAVLIEPGQENQPLISLSQGSSIKFAVGGPETPITQPSHFLTQQATNSFLGIITTFHCGFLRGQNNFKMICVQKLCYQLIILNQFCGISNGKVDLSCFSFLANSSHPFQFEMQISFLLWNKT